jgi:hypothetical protein
MELKRGEETYPCVRVPSRDEGETMVLTEGSFGMSIEPASLPHQFPSLRESRQVAWG